MATCAEEEIDGREATRTVTDDMLQPFWDALAFTWQRARAIGSNNSNPSRQLGQRLDGFLKDHPDWLGDIFEKFPLLMHALVAAECTLESLHMVHAACPNAVRERLAGGHLPLHTAISLNPLEAIHGDTLTFLIEAYPDALTDVPNSNQKAYVYPLHVLLGRIKEPTVEQLELFLPPSAEHLLLKTDASFEWSEERVISPMEWPRFPGRSPAACYFAKRQGQYLIQQRYNQDYLQTWVATYLESFVFNQDDWDMQLSTDACRIACETLLMPLNEQRETILHWLFRYPEHVIGDTVQHSFSLATSKPFLDCLDYMKEHRLGGDSGILDQDGNTPLHLYCSRLSLAFVLVLLETFPSIWRTRNRQGLTPFMTMCLNNSSSSEHKNAASSSSMGVSAIYTVLRKDPGIVLADALGGVETLP